MDFKVESKRFELSGCPNVVARGNVAKIKENLYVADFEDDENLTDDKIDEAMAKPFEINEDVKDFLRRTSDIYCVIDGYPFEERKVFRRIENETYQKQDITTDDFIKILIKFCKRFKRAYNNTPEELRSFHPFEYLFFEGITLIKTEDIFPADGYISFDFGS